MSFAIYTHMEHYFLFFSFRSPRPKSIIIVVYYLVLFFFFFLWKWIIFIEKVNNNNNDRYTYKAAEEKSNYECHKHVLFSFALLFLYGRPFFPFERNNIIIVYRINVIVNFSYIYISVIMQYIIFLILLLLVSIHTHTHINQTW